MVVNSKSLLLLMAGRESYRGSKTGTYRSQPEKKASKYNSASSVLRSSSLKIFAAAGVSVSKDDLGRFCGLGKCDAVSGELVLVETAS